MNDFPSFRHISCFSGIFATFPFETSHFNGGHVWTINRKKIRCCRFFCVFVTIVRVFSLSADTVVNFTDSIRISVIFRVFNTLMLYLIAILVYGCLAKNSYSLCDWMNKISDIFLSLGVDHRSFKSFNRLVVFYSVGFFVASNFPTLIGLWANGGFIDSWIAFFDSICFVWWLLLENSFLCQFLIFMNIARIGFHRIGEVLRGNQFKSRNSKDLSQKLGKIRRQHLTLTDFYDFLSSSLGLNLLMYIFWSFCSVTISVVSLVVMDMKDALILVMWASYHLFQNFPIVSMCEAVSAEGKKAANWLHELLIENEDENVKEEIEIFSLQLQHRPPEMNVCGFFSLNFPLLHSMAAVITTYIIALLQVPAQPVVFSTNQNFTSA